MARVIYLENGQERVTWGDVYKEGQFIRVAGSYAFGQTFNIRINTMNVVSIKE
ncbi:MAG: hypothetical protein MUO82_09975 [Candidatus Thermoplasmatota archaeon]|nr:hypothetical protein [Candidatus Thermoplasmatota archaeon]